MYDGADGDPGAGLLRGGIGGAGTRRKTRRDLRETEVHDLHVTALGQEDVPGLDVAMDDAVGVRRVQRIRGLDADVDQVMI